MRNSDTCVIVETIFGGNETPVLDLRQLWKIRDTCVNVETLLVEKRHLCQSRDTFGGKETPLQRKDIFGRKETPVCWHRDTLGGTETSVSA